MSPALDERGTSLLREAAQWRMLGLLFECPSDHWRKQIAALATEIEDEDLRAAAEQAQTQAAEGAYHSILGPGGPAPAREVSYHDTLQLGHLLSELASYYGAFSFEPTTVEALDHISVEAGFVGYLRLKQAFAEANGETERAEVAAETADAFLKDHLAYVAQPFARALSGCGVPYLALAAKALLARTGPSPALPVIQTPGADAQEDSTFDCGL
jgi:nitrate reductase assembly molybdenum cofactor insertion protein NarJ